MPRVRHPSDLFTSLSCAFQRDRFLIFLKILGVGFEFGVSRVQIGVSFPCLHVLGEWERLLLTWRRDGGVCAGGEVAAGSTEAIALCAMGSILSSVLGRLQHGMDALNFCFFNSLPGSCSSVARTPGVRFGH